MGNFRIIKEKEHLKNQPGIEVKDLQDLHNKAWRFKENSFYLKYEEAEEPYQYKMRRLSIPIQANKSILNLIQAVVSNANFKINITYEKRDSIGKFSLLNHKQYEGNQSGKEFREIRQLDRELRKPKKDKVYLKYEKKGKEYLYEMEKVGVQMSFRDFGVDFKE